MKGKKKMLIILGVLLIIVGVSLVFFNISYSKLKSDFNKQGKDLIGEVNETGGVFSEEDIKNLPTPLQKYFRNSGLIGKKKMSYMNIKFEDVMFSLGKDKGNVKIYYEQYNFTDKPNRIAFIDTKMYGIPFQGLDSYVDGVGSMKGVLGKLITLFDQRGESMDKASLVTYLAECFILPTVALQDFITWEEIDDLHVKATIKYYGISASGIFTFNDSGEMLSFYTEDREATSMDGKVEKVPWTVYCSNYKVINGIKQPTKLQAIWNYEDKDLLYFDADNFVIQYY